MTVELKPAVFLDRDGVINYVITDQSSATGWRSPNNIHEFKYLPGVIEAVRTLRQAGFLVFIVTNQPGIHYKRLTAYDLHVINSELYTTLGVTDIRCATNPSDVVGQYKPGNGMIEDLIKVHYIDRERSVLVGDRWKDIIPGNTSKLTTIYVGAEPYYVPEDYINEYPYPSYACADLKDAANTILAICSRRFYATK